jgi:tRNA threonylcarbamoyladenosine biosynthesis protein TsaE
LGRSAQPTLAWTSSRAETEAIGARLAADLRSGDVVLVSGELGVGKTTLIRGACRELGVTEQVLSPTFTIGRRYRGRVPVAHLDLFRLESLDREEPGLLEDYLGPDTVVFIEWPPGSGSVAWEARVAVRVELRHAGGNEREIRVARQ